MSAPATYDVAIVGAGVIGAAVAWRASQRGLSVALVDDAPGHGASYAAAGMLAPVSEAAYGEEALLALCLESARRYEGFLAELASASGLAIPHQNAATLVVATDDDDLRALDRLHEYHRELGLSARPVTARECRRLEPLLSPRLRGGLAVDSDHVVDPRALVGALLAAGAAAGVRLVRQRARSLTTTAATTTTTGIATATGAAVTVTGIGLDDGTELAATSVVLAAGAWSGRAAATGLLANLPEQARPPVRPVKGQVLRLKGPSGVMGLSRTVRGWVHGTHVYAVPYGDGRVVVGATSEERGFDTTVTAGATYELLRDALTLLPALGELEHVETVCRLRPGTPDNAPLLGPSSLPGLVLATGHYRSGVLLAPVTADAIADYLADGVLSGDLGAFSPKRFGAEAALQAVP